VDTGEADAGTEPAAAPADFAQSSEGVLMKTGFRAIAVIFAN
jgi:hypothetical protein